MKIFIKERESGIGINLNCDTEKFCLINEFELTLTRQQMKKLANDLNNIVSITNKKNENK